MPQRSFSNQVKESLSVPNPIFALEPLMVFEVFVTSSQCKNGIVSYKEKESLSGGNRAATLLFPEYPCFRVLVQITVLGFIPMSIFEN